MVRIVIAAQKRYVCQKLKAMLRARTDISVEYCACDGEMLAEYAKMHRPDVVLMDMRLPKKNGVECTEAIRGMCPDVKILIMAETEDEEYIFNAIRAGANGFVPGSVKKEELAEAVDKVCGQGALIHPEIAVKLFGYLSDIAGRNEPPGDRASFSQTEMKIIKLVGTGLSNKEIARKLCLSDGTCRNYISEILNKTELRDRTQLAIFAIRKGIALSC